MVIVAYKIGLTAAVSGVLEPWAGGGVLGNESCGLRESLDAIISTAS